MMTFLDASGEHTKAANTLMQPWSTVAVVGLMPTSALLGHSYTWALTFQQFDDAT